MQAKIIWFSFLDLQRQELDIDKKFCSYIKDELV